MIIDVCRIKARVKALKKQRVLYVYWYMYISMFTNVYFYTIKDAE